MFYDLLVHVDLPDESRFVMALGNINNYLAALNGEPCTVVLLASVARAAETVEQNDLADIFQGFDGTFIMYDEGADRYTVFNKALSETRLPPCSTFKVFHALIGLDTPVPS